ncbi:hypothetical protein MKX08_004469 [Trichoderma sp. CBMAI-0020]|nr:hypothetical protein MKX08_004469 [Trichoderma sp. CBMAI-0020]
MAFSLSNLVNLTSTLLLTLSDPLQQLFAPNIASSPMAAKPTGLLATKGIELLTWALLSRRTRYSCPALLSFVLPTRIGQGL